MPPSVAVALRRRHYDRFLKSCRPRELGRCAKCLRNDVHTAAAADDDDDSDAIDGRRRSNVVTMQCIDNGEYSDERCYYRAERDRATPYSTDSARVISSSTDVNDSTSNPDPDIRPPPGRLNGHFTHGPTPIVAYLNVTRSSATAEIAQVGGHYAVQDHSMPLMLGSIESPYATSYY